MKGGVEMKAYFRWYNHVYVIVDSNTKLGQAFINEFAKKATPDGVTIFDCYDNHSYNKRNAYRALVDMFYYTTITAYNTFRFTAMSTLKDLDALFIDTAVNGYVVADRGYLKRFADAMNVGFCEYREGK